MTLFETGTAVQGHLFEPVVFRQIRERALNSTEKGRMFEQVMRGAFEANPEFDFQHVWLWNEWPERTELGYTVDIGVDLVAQRRHGGRVGVQCKFYKDAKVATKGINDFLALALNDDFDGSILVSTGQIPKHAATKLIKGGTKLIDLAELESWPVDWLAGLEDPDAVEWASEPKRPFPHQQEALIEISKGFQEHRRGTVVMPCGTGKSLVAMWAAEEHAGRGGSVLYAVPSIALMGQTMREWARNRSIAHSYFGVCSDPSTGRLPRGAADELAAVQIPVSTDRADIARRLAEAPRPDEMRVVLTTYHSLPVVADAIEHANQAIRSGGHGFEPFDLFVLDEAHRTTGIEDAEAKTDRVSGFRLAHDDRRLPALRRLYMTATPRVFTPRLKAKAAKMSEEAGRDLDSYSMDDDAVYGPRFFKMAFSDAIDQGLLTDYRVLVVGKRAGSNELSDAYVEVLRTEDARRKSSARGGLVAEGYATKLLGVLDALAAPKTVRSDPQRMSGQIAPQTGAPLRSAILFASTVAKSKLVGEAGGFAELLGNDHSLLSAISDDLRAKSRAEGEAQPILRIETDHMDGKTRADVRARQLSWLRAASTAQGPLEDSGSDGESRRQVQGDGGDQQGATCRVLANAKVLSEGVDVPALDAVVFMDPRKSTIDITQAVGRAIRRADGKELGYIVIPVVVPEGSEMTSEEVLAGSDFSTVWEVVRALRSHDDRVDHWLNGVSTKPPIDVIAPDDGDSDAEDADDADPAVEQLALDLQIKQRLEREVFSKMVDLCGDRQMWPTWGKNAAKVCDQVRDRLSGELLAPMEAQQEFETFLTAIRETAGERITYHDALEMVAQHVVTIPIFDALFADSGFAKENPMSKAMDRLLAALAQHSGHIDADDAADLAGFDLAEQVFGAELTPLTRAYRTMRSMLSDDITPAQKVDLMRQIYDGFFAHAMEDVTKRLGIVYTPVEIVDFMVRATDAICRKHFGKGLTAEGVHILDPFVGTGTFIHQILTIKGADDRPIIRREDLARKYRHELHATELVLLAYYVAALKIEAGMESRDGFDDGQFQQFENIVYGDTFLQNDALSNGRLEGTEDNTLIAQMQNQLPIRVIISNPPWSAGQKRANDDNPNIGYPEIEQRVRDTYGKRHREVTGQGSGKSGGNLYVEAIRWASDRVGDPVPTTPRRCPEVPGVVAFVHPNSLATGISLAGMRAALRDEFSDIYVVNLRGDAYKQGEEFKREGDKLFGGGSRNGVQITFLVSDPDAPRPDGPAALHYAEVPEYQHRTAKFAWLESIAPGTDTFWDSFEKVPIGASHDWVNLTDNAFGELPISLCALTRDRRDDVAVSQHALGLTTNCDTYVYSFSRDDLAERMRAFVAAYERARRAIHERNVPLDVATADEEVEDIKWHARLRQAVKANIQIEFDEDRIRPVLYRPFQQLWLYEDDRILSSVKTIAAMFPRDGNDPPPPALGLDTNQPSHLRMPHNSCLTRPLRRWDESADPSHPAPAILMTTPSNMALFAVLATPKLADLHATAPGQATRCLPRRS
ncbi:type ISP restriction/modification enzyme [Candidatus Poriferisodalis sp.]|uniref:restriction endonuclease n=1 Tax=Candidatus Poriferisodalis sp. TaxID=3101277 RepID=UPI003B02CD89